ncbi:hypothetical protein CGT98_08270 [Vibrio metoecus]|nr:hypothetical protein CGT98_08270 [Vibrio metoecus]
MLRQYYVSANGTRLPFLLAGLWGFDFGDLWFVIMVPLLVVSLGRDKVQTGKPNLSIKQESTIHTKSIEHAVSNGYKKKNVSTLTLRHVRQNT